MNAVPSPATAHGAADGTKLLWHFVGKGALLYNGGTASARQREGGA